MLVLMVYTGDGRVVLVLNLVPFHEYISCA